MPYVYLSDRNEERLARIVTTGLYGDGEAEVMAGAVMALIREAVEHGFIQLDPAPDEPEATVGKSETGEKITPPVSPPSPAPHAAQADDDILF